MCTCKGSSNKVPIKFENLDLYSVYVYIYVNKYIVDNLILN